MRRPGWPDAMAGTALADLTWQEVEPRTLLVPVGSLEQHGPHLPLDTDTRIAEAVAEAAAHQIDGAVVAPPVAYGDSGEHQAFPGTLSCGTAALTLLLVELGRSAMPPFEAVVFVNGHGGNLAALDAAVATLTGEGRRVAAWSASVRHGDAHAGHVETSLLLAIAPDAVRADRLAPGDVRPLAMLLPQLRAEGVRAVSPSGVLGDPTDADAEQGKRLLEGLTADLVETVTR